MADNYLERQYEKLIGQHTYVDPESGWSAKRKVRKRTGSRGELCSQGASSK